MGPPGTTDASSRTTLGRAPNMANARRQRRRVTHVDGGTTGSTCVHRWCSLPEQSLVPNRRRTDRCPRRQPFLSCYSGRGNREPRRQHEHTHAHTPVGLRSLVVGGPAARWFSLFTRDDAVGWPALDDGGRRCVQCVRAGENKIIRRCTTNIVDDVNNFEVYGRVAPPYVMEQTSRRTPIDIIYSNRGYLNNISIGDDNRKTIRFRISLNSCCNVKSLNKVYTSDSYSAIIYTDILQLD